MTEQDATESGQADDVESSADGEQSAAEPGDDVAAEGVGAAGDGTGLDEGVEVDEDVDLDDAVDESLVERVAESDPESIAHELVALRTRVDGLEDQLAARDEELDDLTEKLKRKQADFKNFKKRMEKRREQERERATEDLVERLLDVRDNLQRALEQDEDADIRGGVETTLRSFDDVLDQENVDVIEPAPGEEVDPHRHEVLVRVDSDQPEGSIAEVHRPGYVMAEKVLRPAQVTVSDG